MINLLYVAFGYLLVTSFILLRNRLHFTTLRSSQTSPFTDDARMVSFCIPARNEQLNIKRCVESALGQTYPNLEVLVLDDHSDDRTPDILSEIQENHPKADRLQVLRGKPKPDGWLGKPWACQQLSEAADGDILIFADADTWHSPQTAGDVVRSMGKDVIDMLTVWPRQKLNTFWEKMLIPLVYYALLSLLPVHYVYRSPRWMPAFVHKKIRHLLAAACGQFMAFKRSAYDQIGGHQSVRQEIVEDVKLAKKIKSAGLKLRMYYGGGDVACRMYRSHSEIKTGFRKNFFVGFGYNVILFLGMALLHLVVFVLPAVLLFWSFWSGSWSILLWSSAVAGIMLLHRFMLARWFGWQPVWAWLHPLSVLWFEWLGILTLYDYFLKKNVKWKGREI